MYPRVDVVGYTMFTSSHLKNHLAKITKMLKKTHMLNDHRAIVIVSALFVEKTINDFLSSIIPDFNKLDKKRYWTFSLKIDLSNSFKLCPKKYFKYSHKIREIRNEFAHNSEIISISDLDPKYMKSLLSFCDNIEGREQIKDMNSIEIYLFVIKTLIVNIMMRAQGNKCWNIFLRTEQFKENLHEYIGTLEPTSLYF